MLLPDRLDDKASAIVRPIRDRPITDLPRPAQTHPATRSARPSRDGVSRMPKSTFRPGSCSSASPPRSPRSGAIRKRTPLRKTLLKVELLPYQLDGIAFAAGAGRAILADDMGLGKTIQGIGMAELLAREAGIRKVLIVCPASVKSQWRSEILRFSERNCQIVLGGAARTRLPVRERMLLHHLQLRAGAARHPCDRARQMGPDRSRRGPTHQELGGEDDADHEEPALAVRARALRHAARESARRSLLGRRSSSTTGDSVPRSGSSTAIASRTRKAKSSATRISTCCARA